MNVAPSSSRRSPDSSVPGASRSAMRSAWRRNVPARSRWRPPKRAVTTSSAAATSLVVELEDVLDDARTPCPRRPPARAWPGTNSCVITRDASGTSRSGSRVASASDISRAPVPGPSVLERGDQRQRRLGALVEVGRRRRAARRSRRRSSGSHITAPASLAPRNQPAASSMPAPPARCHR